MPDQPLGFEIEVDGLSMYTGALQRLAEFAQDLSEPFREISKDFQRVEGERFNRQGPGWAPLAPATLLRKRGPSILVETGALKESLMGGAGFIEVITDSQLIAGTDIPYARYHQRGTRRMPVREVIKPDATATTGWLKIIQRHLVERAREAGF